MMLAQLAATLLPLGYVNQARLRFSEALSEELADSIMR
jgi:hypothetical protein